MQGLEFYPEDTALHYMAAGLYLKNQHIDLAKEKLHYALQLNPDKSVVFLQQFPECAKVQWVRDCIKANKKAST